MKESFNNGQVAALSFIRDHLTEVSASYETVEKTDFNNGQEAMCQHIQEVIEKRIEELKSD